TRSVPSTPPRRWADRRARTTTVARSMSTAAPACRAGSAARACAPRDWPGATPSGAHAASPSFARAPAIAIRLGASRAGRSGMSLQWRMRWRGLGRRLQRLVTEERSVLVLLGASAVVLAAISVAYPESWPLTALLIPLTIGSVVIGP